MFPSFCGFDVFIVISLILNFDKSITICPLSEVVSLLTDSIISPELFNTSICPSVPSTSSNSCFDIFNVLYSVNMGETNEKTFSYCGVAFQIEDD